MLGLGPIASRSISGSPFKLTLVQVYGVAAGALLTFGGLSTPGATIPASASGPIVTLSGTATARWTQTLQASGNIVTFSGDAELHILGPSIIFETFAENLTFDAQSERLEFIAKADNLTFHGGR